jgi:hypothetical protein
MRRSVLVVLGLLLLWPGAADARAPCERAGFREVARNHQAVVLVRRGAPGVKAGCMLRDDKLVYLSDPNDDYVSHVTLAGHFVAFYDHYIDGADPDFETAQLIVTDVRRRKAVFTDRTTLYSRLPVEDQDPPQRGLPVIILLKHNGSVAWSTCPWHSRGGPFGEPLACNRPGPRAHYQVVVHPASKRNRDSGRILDEGPTVDPASLRLEGGSALSWTNGDGRQQAQLR